MRTKKSVEVITRSVSPAVALVLGATMLAPMGAARGADAAGSEAANNDSGSPENVIQEVVITGARKRAESAQDTPLPITAINTEMLERFHVSELTDVQQLSPNLSIHKAYVAPDVASVFLRGFGDRSNIPSIEPPVPIVIDGVYLPSVNGSMIDQFDTATIEVLKGPQSTLIGKNSASGAINITTIRPSTDAFSAKAQVDYARFDKLEARAAVNVPLRDDLAVRLSVYRGHGGNYVKNLNTNETDQGGIGATAVRLGVAYKPTKDISWYVTSTYAVDRFPQEGQRLLSYPGSGDPWTPTPLSCIIYQHCAAQALYTTQSGFTGGEYGRDFTVSSNLDINAGPVRVSAVTGYKHLYQEQHEDVDAHPEAILDVGPYGPTINYFQQELRLANVKGGGLDLDGHLDWVTGVIYDVYRYIYSQPTQVLVPIVPVQSHDEKERAKNEAVFAHAEYTFNEAWSANLGVRYTRDVKDYAYTNAYTYPGRIDFTTGLPAQFIPNSATFNRTTFEGGPTWHFAPHKLVFARLATGYRGGGLNPVPPGPQNPTVYKPETVKSAEIGLKTEWFEQRLRANLNVFYNRYSNLQRDVTKAVFDSSGAQSGYVQVIANAAQATTKGVELELIAVPVDDLTLRFNAGHMNATYQNYIADLAGKGIATDYSYFRFPFAPDTTLFGAADYVFYHGDIGRFTAGASYDWRSRQLVSVSDTPAAEQAGYGLLNAQLRYDAPQSRYFVQLYAQNVLDKHYLLAYEDASGITTGVLDGPPTTFGITIGASF